MNRYININIVVLTLLLSSCAGSTSFAKNNTFYEVKPFIKIESSDGVNRKEANMILGMYQEITLGSVTLYYSALENDKQNWVSRKKGHWGYQAMEHPILINKLTGSIEHANTHYPLGQLIQKYKKLKRK